MVMLNLKLVNDEAADEASTTENGTAPDRINPTTTGGGSTVLIRGRTCRALLVDKGKPVFSQGIRSHAQTSTVQSQKY